MQEDKRQKNSLNDMMELVVCLCVCELEIILIY